MPKLLAQGVSAEPKTGRHLIGIVAGFKSERWPVIDRNARRLHVGIRRGYVRLPLTVPRVRATSHKPPDSIIVSSRVKIRASRCPRSPRVPQKLHRLNGDLNAGINASSGSGDGADRTNTRHAGASR